jgi:hypothetical protein
VPEIRLDVTDAAELAEMLQFLSQWLARDPGRLGASLEEFVGHPAYGIQQLHGGLERFVFLLGGGGCRGDCPAPGEVVAFGPAEFGNDEKRYRSSHP